MIIKKEWTRARAWKNFRVIHHYWTRWVWLGLWVSTRVTLFSNNILLWTWAAVERTCTCRWVSYCRLITKIRICYTSWWHQCTEFSNACSSHVILTCSNIRRCVHTSIVIFYPLCRVFLLDFVGISVSNQTSPQKPRCYFSQKNQYLKSVGFLRSNKVCYQ